MDTAALDRHITGNWGEDSIDDGDDRDAGVLCGCTECGHTWSPYPDRYDCPRCGYAGIDDGEQIEATIADAPPLTDDERAAAEADAERRYGA